MLGGGVEVVGAVTEMAADPVMPSIAAEMVADPAASPLTRPELETVATEVLFDIHVTVRPVIVLPAESRAVAVAWLV